MKKCIVFLYITIILLLFSNLCYSSNNYNYAYYYNIDSKYFYIIELTTNKIINIDLINIVPNDENIDCVSEIKSDYESDYQVFSITTKKKNNFWFIVNKHETTKNFIIPDPSLEITYGYRSILFNNFIFYPIYNKNTDFYIYNILNNKSYIIPNFNKSILALGSLPKNIQTSIEQTKEKYFYDYHYSEFGGMVFSENKIYFVIKYYLGGGGVGRWPNLQYVRLASINTKTNKCTVEKENFYVVEALYKISNDIVLLFTKDKIIKYNLTTNTGNEFLHKLNLVSPNDVFDRVIKIYPLSYNNNKIFFIANNPYKQEKEERRQLISFDFIKTDIISDKDETNYLSDIYSSNNSFFLLSQDKNEKDFIFNEINLEGKSLSKIKIKGTYPYKIIGTKKNNLYLRVMDGSNLILMTYDIIKKKIINKNILK